jgi:cytochrome c553
MLNARGPAGGGPSRPPAITAPDTGRRGMRYLPGRSVPPAPAVPTMRRLLETLLPTALLLAALPHAAGQPPQQPGIAPDLQAALALRGDAARGREAFDDCSACHRRDALGRPNANIPRLAGQHASVIVKQLTDVRAGRRVNTPMRPLIDVPAITPQTLADLGAYLQSLPVPPDTARGPGTAVAQGKALYERDCASCHGRAGEGRAAAFYPMVAAQHHGYLLRELQMIRGGERGNSNPEMTKVVQAYAQADLEALADYMAQLPAPRR